MNTKILMSLVTIGLVASVVGVGTYAYFSDTETSSGNTLTGGVLNLKVNGHDGCPGCTVVTVGDLKPSFTRYSNDIVLEINDNPGKLYKRITAILCENYIQTEPEVEEETQSGCPKFDLDKYTWFDLEKWNGAGWDVAIPDNLVTIEDMVGKWIYLGEYLPVPNQLKIRQSFHLKSSVTNWAQGDKCIFTEEFMVNQVKAPDPDNCWNCPLILENKDASWNVIEDDRYAILNFMPKGPEFFYGLEAHGLEANTAYSLIYYADLYPGNHPGALIAQGTSDVSGELAIAGSVDLNMDLPHPSDANYPGGAKVWLVPSNRYDAATKSIIGWNPAEYLFETRTIQYDDTEVP